MISFGSEHFMLVDNTISLSIISCSDYDNGKSANGRIAERTEDIDKAIDNYYKEIVYEIYSRKLGKQNDF